MKHSDKALETLRQMGTQPGEWHLTPIEWVEEEREVPGDVRCPECDGGKWVVYDENGDAGTVPKLVTGTGDYSARIESQRARDDYQRQARRSSPGSHYGNCRRCRGTRPGRFYNIPKGTVRGRVLAKVMVGYPIFPAGARFDSRFSDNGNCCELCDKLIQKSGRVPVNTDGNPAHAMWVGEDCARKFLDVKIKRAANAVMEDAKTAA